MLLVIIIGGLAKNVGYNAHRQRAAFNHNAAVWIRPNGSHQLRFQWLDDYDYDELKKAFESVPSSKPRPAEQWIKL